MDTTGGASHENNVFVLKVPKTNRALAKLLKNRDDTKSYSVSPYDREDVILASEAVVENFRNCLSRLEEKELFGFVLDGKISDERSSRENQILDRMINFFVQKEGRVFEDIKPAVFEAAVFDDKNLSLDPPLRVLTVVDDAGKATIYIANQLGLRESLLVARDGYSDYAIILAESLGIRLSGGDVAKQLSEAITSGAAPAVTSPDRRPKMIHTMIGERQVIGVPR